MNNPSPYDENGERVWKSCDKKMPMKVSESEVRGLSNIFSMHKRIAAMIRDAERMLSFMKSEWKFGWGVLCSRPFWLGGDKQNFQKEEVLVEFFYSSENCNWVFFGHQKRPIVVFCGKILKNQCFSYVLCKSISFISVEVVKRCWEEVSSIYAIHRNDSTFNYLWKELKLHLREVVYLWQNLLPRFRKGVRGW